MLLNKQVLLLAPSFFGYEFEIKTEIEKLGANVTYFNERPSNNFFTKVLIRLGFKNFMRKKLDAYFHKIINSITELDYVLLINPETIREDDLLLIKKKNPTVKIIIYMWDSISNKRYATDYLNISDSFYTFDKNDLALNSKVKFLPLFYVNDYAQLAQDTTRYYDLTFIGTVHSDRFNLIKQVEDACHSYGLKTFVFLYSPSRGLFFFQKLFDKRFKSIKWSDVNFTSLSKKDVLNIIEKSKAILDIEHHDQQGLTMRTIEMLGAKRKLITTNESIKEYNFFNSNIYVIDRKQPFIPVEFFNSEFQIIENEIYTSYSLDSWIKKIFN